MRVSAPQSSSKINSATKLESAPRKNMVPWGERFSYSLSDFACNLSFSLVSTYLMFFYTDVFGISAAVVGTLFLAARIVDAFDGPFWGIMIDHTHTRWGKSRPYWLWFSIPFAVFSVLCFTVPNMSTGMKVIWAYVTYIGVDILYSAVNIPITSILPSLTGNPQERVTLSTIRQFMGTLGATIISTVALPLVAYFGGGSTSSAHGWFIVALIMAVIAWLFSSLYLLIQKNVFKPFNLRRVFQLRLH